MRAFDTRLAAREEVESLGAKFLELEFEEDGDGAGGYAKLMSPEFIEAEMALSLAQAPITDVVITTAAIPGRKAPLLLKREMVEAMKPGSIIVDLAAETGGNCELTVAGEAIEHHGVTIIGYTDLTSRMATHASEFFGRNIDNLFSLFGTGEEFSLNLDDFVGWKVIWNVKASLHTPLMSVTNAISGIIIVGGILKATSGASTEVLLLAGFATLVASINVFGGFFVTQRMLKMFRSEKEARHA